MRAENKRMRRDLEDLEALEKARKRVQRQPGEGGLRLQPGHRRGRPGVAGERHGQLPVRAALGTPARRHRHLRARRPRDPRGAGRAGCRIRGPVSGYGNYTCVQHTKDFQTCYAHQSRFLVEKGEDVVQGQAIGLVGCTGRCFGDHLHFEVYVNNRPTDPMPYL